VDFLETGWTQSQASGLGITTKTQVVSTLPRLGSRVRIPSSAPMKSSPQRQYLSARSKCHHRALCYERMKAPTDGSKSGDSKANSRRRGSGNIFRVADQVWRVDIKLPRDSVTGRGR
jgi:hypothetical protein